MKNKEFKKLKKGQRLVSHSVGLEYVFAHYSFNKQIVHVFGDDGLLGSFTKKYVMANLELLQ
jgi:hypothetical protein